MDFVFFILSFSRSGSTLLTKLLNNHNDIQVANETWVFPTVSILGWTELNYNKQRYILYVYNQSLKIFANFKPITHEICDRETVSFKSFYRKLQDTHSLLHGEKNPVNTFHFSYLHKSFIDAKYIFLTRNPLAIANSYKNRWFKGKSDNDFLFKVTVIIKSYFLSYQNYNNNNNIITIRYEDLVNEPKISLNQICNHLGVKYDDVMLSNLDNFILNSENLHHHKDLYNSVNKKNINKYKTQMTQQEIQNLSYLLRDVINFFNYPDSYFKPTKSLLRIERKVNNRLRYNNSFIRIYLRKMKYYLFYLKFIITK